MAKIKTVGLTAILFLACAPANLWSQQNAALNPASASTHAAAPAAATAADDRPALQQRNPRYQVQRDDILVISFALSPELDQTVTVQPDGYITLTNVGGVFVQGMSVPQVVEAIKKAYAGTLHDPIIDVNLKDFQKPYFVALGQVGKPGQYDLRYDMTVTEAIAIAGGFLPTGKDSGLPLPPRIQRVGRSERAEHSPDPGGEKCQRRPAHPARRHDFRPGKIHREIQEICAVQPWHGHLPDRSSF